MYINRTNLYRITWDNIVNKYYERNTLFIAQCKKSTLLLFDGCNNIYNRTSFCAISHGLNLAMSSPRGTSSK